MRKLLALVAVLVPSLAVAPCSDDPRPRFTEPQGGELRLASEAVPFTLLLPGGVVAVELRVDEGPPLDPAQVQVGPGAATGSLGVLAPGRHVVTARVATSDGAVAVRDTWFELVDLENPDECENLNAVECLLPYPSSRFQRPAASETGVLLDLPESGMPMQVGMPVDVAPFNVLDGFSPTVQVMMHFPGGVDLVQSGAPRLLPATRITDFTSIEGGSPSLLIDAETGERVLHFLENDTGVIDFLGQPLPVDPARRFTFLRPGRSLEDDRRYLVAVRGLVHGDGTPVEAEPVFAALRDGRPTSIPGVEAQRAQVEATLDRLEELGVPRDDLILAFEFHTRSDEQMTRQMLSMRDQAFDWLDAQMEAAATLFDVESVEERDCSNPDESLWRYVEGTYRVPLFLGADPETENQTVAFLVTDAEGLPVVSGETNPRFGIAIPCNALQGAPVHPVVWGHGLFGDGSRDVRNIVAGVGSQLVDWDLDNGLAYTFGGTRWRGLSSPDIDSPTNLNPPTDSWLVKQILTRLNNFPAMVDRLRQGQTNTLVLARMMKRGVFNDHPAFQLPTAPGEPVAGVFPGEEREMYYFGASLGGIMGIMFAALSPDVIKHNVDVPGINFSLLLQRATPFLLFETLLSLTGVDDNIEIALGIGLLHEQWVMAEPAGYVRHITRDNFPGVPEKQILLTVAFLDQQVSNTASEVAARSLGIPQLEGSLFSDRLVPGIETASGPLRSAMVVYDTASFELDDPNDQPFIPPLGNDQAQPSGCDPHGRRAFTPASLQQLVNFLRPDDPADPSAGRVVNFCDGLCDADFGAVRTLSDGSDLRFEIPFNDTQRCQP